MILMALVINEKKMVDDNMFGFEERVKSPLTRFSEKTFTPVEYYHINNVESTADAGFEDIEEILGERSPLRFRVIHDFPLYGLEGINLDISEEDVGLDSEYSSEATILPGTITPYQNDFFVLKQLKEKFVFRVTEVQHDTIMTDNFWKINFQLEYIDVEKQESLDKQTTEKYSCLMENIGTDERCIIEDEYYEEMRKIDKMYQSIVDTYTTIFYVKKYNCLLGDLDSTTKIYDPFQTEFIMKHQLLRVNNQLDNLVFTEQFSDSRRKLKYERTIYRFIETRDLSRLTRFPFCTFLGINNRSTAFYRWVDKHVKILDIEPNMGQDALCLLTDDSVNTIRMNYPTDSKYLALIANYIRNDQMSLNEIDLGLEDEILNALDANIEIFFFTPIILYIIKDVMHKFVLRQKEKEH